MRSFYKELFMNEKIENRISNLDIEIDLSDEALEMSAGNQLEIGACITSTDFTLCGCKGRID
jgi:hypothetical protein